MAITKKPAAKKPAKKKVEMFPKPRSTKKDGLGFYGR